MKKYVVILPLLIVISAYSQNIPDKTNTLIIKGATFKEACVALLDKGYTIEKKDDDLQFVRTEPKRYDKKFNAAYTMNIRAKDSVIIIKGTFTAPYDHFLTKESNRVELFKDDPLIYRCNKKGEPRSNRIDVYGFMQVVKFAKLFEKEISYTKE